MKGCMTFLRYFAFSFNFLVWLIGMIMLGAGVWLRLDPITNQFVTAADGVDMYYITTYVLIGAGGLLTIVGFIGCCGAFQESICMLGIFFVLLFLIVCAEMAGGVLAFIHGERVSNNLTEGMRRSIKTEYGVIGGMAESIDFIQKSLVCCGSAGPDDYKGSLWHMDGNVDQIPASCCNQTSPHKTACEWMGSSATGTFNPALFKKGCTQKIYVTVLFFVSSNEVPVYEGVTITHGSAAGQVFGSKRRQRVDKKLQDGRHVQDGELSSRQWNHEPISRAAEPEWIAIASADSEPKWHPDSPPGSEAEWHSDSSFGSDPDWLAEPTVGRKPSWLAEALGSEPVWLAEPTDGLEEYWPAEPSPRTNACERVTASPTEAGLLAESATGNEPKWFSDTPPGPPGPWVPRQTTSEQRQPNVAHKPKLPGREQPLRSIMKKNHSTPRKNNHEKRVRIKQDKIVTTV